MNIVFLIFNRADLTAQVFARIREARPSQLFIVADGPRSDCPEDGDKVAAARAVTEQIDWPCAVHRDYSERNLGCGRRVSSGISWAFQHVDAAIVLEDDCVPHMSFFSYCTALLEHYGGDERVTAISGDNFQGGIQRGRSSYYFSNYAHCWGWATWRRAWKHFNLAIPFWPDVRGSGLLESVVPHGEERAYWTEIFDRAYRGEIDSWAYPWQLCVWLQSGLTALPNANLVTNIGVGEDATHTVASGPNMGLKACELGELMHPQFVCRDGAADLHTYLSHFGGGRRECRRRAGPREMARSVGRKLKALARGGS